MEYFFITCEYLNKKTLPSPSTCAFAVDNLKGLIFCSAKIHRLHRIRQIAKNNWSTFISDLRVKIVHQINLDIEQEAIEEVFFQCH